MGNIKVWCGMVRLLIIAVAVLLPLAGKTFAATQGPRLTWSVDAQVAIPEQELAARGVTLVKADLVDPIVARLGAKGVVVEVREVSGPGGAPSYVLKTSSTGTIDDFRRTFNTILKPELRALGAVTEMHITSRGAQSLTSDVVVAANPSTGYFWKVAGDGGFTEAAPSDFVMHTRGVGVPQHQILHLRNNGNHDGSIKLVYRRSWEPAATTMRITLDLDYLPPRLDLSDPTVPSGPAPLPARRAVNAAAFPEVDAATLPASLDWRTSGIVTPVRNQGSCGSCWAFGTVGVMESALGKSGVTGLDLSEQFLISCNNDGWDCNGGLTASKYHFDTLGINQTAVGAVLESAKPYTASNGTCPTALSHPYRASGWQFIVPSEFDMPTVDQIKTAIYTYGPITAGVCVGSGWDGYSSGIFMTDETSECDGGTNHQIVLVGWNDNGGTNGYWILRNSWGSTWGIGGYMHIAYNTSRVGEGTSWIAATPSPASSVTLTPNPVSPRPVGTGITFTAAASGGSGSYQYQFWLKNTAGTWSVVRAYSSTPTWTWNTAGLPVGTYSIQVWARNAGSTASYEAYKTVAFTLSTPPPASSVTLTPNPAAPRPVGSGITFTAAASGGSGSYQYQFWLRNPAGTWSNVRAYGATPTWTWNTAGLLEGVYSVQVWAKNSGSSASYEAYRSISYTLLPTVSLTANPPSPRPRGTSITFTAALAGGSGAHEYQFWVRSGTGPWTVGQAYGPSSTWIWNTTGLPSGTYTIQVWVRKAGAASAYDCYDSVSYSLFIAA